MCCLRPTVRSDAYADGEVSEAQEEQGECCGELHGWLVLGCSWVLYVCRWCDASSLVVELFVVQNQEVGRRFLSSSGSMK